jgi:fermentation-respiration switch protein FrsA (DUF1100 family)
VIPFAHGEKLFAAAASQQKQFIRHAGGDHNEPPPEEYRVALDAFFAALPAESSFNNVADKATP